MTNQIAALEKLKKVEVDATYLDGAIQNGYIQAHNAAIDACIALMLNPPADVNISGECVKEKP
jgi:hypothetical protein